MPTRKNVHVFIQENMTSCRKFWGFMYTMFFILAWTSFCSTKGETQLVTTSVYVALGFALYWLMFMVLPLVYLIHQAIKERVDSIKVVFGTEIMDAMCKFLITTTFPIFAICMGGILQDVATFWMCVGFVGSVFCLLICYVNPADFSIYDAFFGLWMGVLLNLEHPREQCVVIVVFGILMFIAKEVMVQEKNVKEVQVLKATHQKG